MKSSPDSFPPPTLLAKALTILALASLPLGSAPAANKIWDGGGSDGLWLSGANWDANTAPSPNDSLFFSGSARLNNTNDFPAGTIFNGISFSLPAGAFVLAGNSITLAGGIANNQPLLTETINLPLALSVTPTINIASNAALTIGGVVSGASAGLVKTGPGLLTLGANNGFGGPISVTAGTLSVASDSNLGSIPGSATPGNIILNGGTLRVTTSLTVNSNRGIALGLAGPGRIDVNSGATMTYRGIIANNGGGSGSLLKGAPGGLTLSRANTYTGTNGVKNGTLTLDFTQADSPLVNVIPAGNITLGGENSGLGTLSFAALTMTGKGATLNTQTFNSTTIDIGTAILRANSGAGGSATLDLGNLTHTPGGVVTFVPPAAGNIITATTNTSGILGGWATLGDGSTPVGNIVIGTNLSRVDSSGNIVNFNDYFTYAGGTLHGSVGADTNVLIAGTGDATINTGGAGTITEINTISMRRGAGNYSIVVGANNTLRLGKFGTIFKQDTTSGTVIVVGTSAGGANGIQNEGTITAGGGPNSSGEIVFDVNSTSQTAGTLSVETRITDNGLFPVRVIKIGPGSMKLRGNNTYSGNLYILQGRVQFAGSEIGAVNPDGAGGGSIFIMPGGQFFPSGATGTFTNQLFIAGTGFGGGPSGCIRMSTGVQQLAGPINLIGDAYISGGAANSANGSISGKISGPFSFGVGMNGGGENFATYYRISNPDNDWSGDTVISVRDSGAPAATLVLANNEVIPDGVGKGNLVFRPGSTAAATLDMFGFSETVNGLTVATANTPNAIIQNSDGSAISVLTVGNNDASSTFAGVIQDNGGQIALTKIGGGQITLAGANTYSSTTTVSNGSLALSGNGTISGSQDILVRAGATLDVSGVSDFTAANTLRLFPNGTLFGSAANVTVPSLRMTNAALSLVVDAAKTNIVAPALITGGVTNLINIVAVANVPGYPVLFPSIKYSGTIGGAGMNFAIGEVPNANTVGYVSNEVASSRMVLVLLDGPKPLTWTGSDAANPTLWDNGTTTNWLAFKGGTNEIASRFSRADSTFFDDTGSTNNVSLVSILAPGGVTVNNTALNYTFSGSGALSGPSGIVKNGTGTLTLANSGNSDFRGGVVINAGTVAFGTDQSGVSGGVRIGTGATGQVGTNGPTGALPGGIIANDGTLTFNRTNDFTVASIISGSSAGTIIKNNNGVLTLSGANTYTGTVTIAQGTLRAGGGSALGRAEGSTIVSSGGTLDVGGQTLTAEPIIASGPGANNVGAIINSGADNINALGNVSLSNHTAFGGSGRWDIRGGAATLTTGGAAYNLTKVGNNQVSLVGVNVDSALADITVSNGIFSVETTTTSLGNPANFLTVYTGGTLQFFGTSTPWDKRFVFYGNGVSNIVNNANGNNTIFGPVTLNGAVVITAGGTSLNIDGSIGGTGGIVKNGGALLSLTALNSYSGATLVNAGTFEINGLNNGGGSLSNAVAGTLTGRGTNTGPVQVNGTLLPGGAGVAGPFGTGPLTMTNAQVTFDLGTNDFNGNFPVNDQIFVNGNLTLNGVITNTIIAGPVGAVTNGQIITLIRYSGTLTGGLPNLKINPPPGYAMSFIDPATTPNQIQVRVDGAPSILVWRGLAAGQSTDWDVNISPNWTNITTGISPSVFTNFDSVVFDDQPATNRITLVGTLRPTTTSFNNNSVAYTIAGTGRITGSGQLNLLGTGSLIIANSGSNDFTGGLNINGTLQVGNGSTAGNLGSGGITNNGSLIFNRSGSLTVNNVITGSGAVTNNGPGIVTLGGANSYAGETFVSQGTLRTGTGTALGTANAGTTISSGATLDVNSQNLSAEPVTVSGSGVTNGGAIVNLGTAQQNALQFVTLTGNTVFGGTGRWDIRGTLASLSTSGNGYNLTKVGPNQFSLVGATVDPALGNINVQSGTFSVETTTTTLGNNANSLTIAPGATLQLFNATVAFDKVFLLNGTGTNTTLNVASGEANNIIGPVTLTGGCIVNCAAGTALAISGPVGGTGSLTKNGAGLLSLSGTTTYSGNCTINNGTLFLAGGATTANNPVITLAGPATLDVSTLTGGPTLQLVNGQTLQGSGAVNGGLNAAAGSIVSPGVTFGTIGTLTITNDITLQGTNILEINKSANANDRLRSILGGITYGGRLVVTNLGGTIVGGESYKIFDSGTASYLNAFASIQLPQLGPGISWNTSQLNSSGTISVDGKLIAPLFGGVSSSGSNVTFSGSGGTTNGTYYVLAATNVAASAIEWLPIQTNNFDSFGRFSFSAPIEPAIPARFFRVQALLP
jgi:autotransporter-associated beta strand protein